MSAVETLRTEPAAAPMTPAEGLAALLQPTLPLTPGTSVQVVAERMLEARHAGLLSLPVVADDGRPVGTISRYELMRILLMPYGRELYGRRPVEVLMAPALVLPIDAPIDDAARAIAEHIRGPITEDFVVVDADGRYTGTGIVLDVLRAVETRLGQRSAELQRAMHRLRSSQLALVQSEKMASLGQMVAGLVHEINTPLGYVRNNVEMTRAALDDARRLLGLYERVTAALYGRDGGPPADLPDLLDEIRRLSARVDASALEDLRGLLDDSVHGVEQIGELVANLKDFSRLDQARTQVAEVDALIASALRITQHLTRKRGIEVVHESGGTAEIECAPAQINQVLLNLIGNAAQAIEHERGRIVIRTQALDGRAMILVEDNGKGIAEEHLARIFDPFFTTKPVGQGTGLGLAISYQIVEQHGGQIRAQSRPGVGTRFLVALPARRSPGDAR